MRILALAHQWIPQHCAGAETMLHSMLRALARRGHQVDVTLSRQVGEPYTLSGVNVWPYVDKRDVFRWLGDADVLVTHLENTPRTAVLGRLNGIPVVQVLHNTMRITKEWLLREPPQLVVANSEWMLADLGEAIPPRTRPLVVRPLVHSGEYATPTDAPRDRVTLVNLRRMETSPGGSTMGKGAEVFWALAERMPNVKFLGVLGGYGGQLVRDDLPNVEVLEHVPHHEMRDRVYARTRVLLMPSSYESWGRVGTEALCSGIPVIAHPTPGLLESLGDAGIFVDRDDVDGWCRALRTLAMPRPYRAAALRAHRRSAELDPAEDLDRWCDAVEQVASRRLVGVR